MRNIFWGICMLFLEYKKRGNVMPPNSKNTNLVISAGVEPAIFWMRTRRPRPLDDETDIIKLSFYG